MAKPLYRVKRYAHSKYKFVVRAKIHGEWKRKYFHTEAEARAYAKRQEALSGGGASERAININRTSAKPDAPVDFSKTTAEELVASVTDWHHRFEIVPGLVTPGSYDPSFLLGKLALPADLSGRRVLDLGPSDGYFSLELRRRGAEVVAVDYRPKELHGFGVMERLSGLDFDYRQANLYDVTPEEFGTFDIVLFLGLLYHLPDLLRALLTVRRVCGGQMFIESHCAMEFAQETAAARYFRESSLSRDFTNFWSPNRRCFSDILYDAGFDVEREETWGDRYFAASRINDDPARALKLKVAYGLFDEAAEARKRLDQQSSGDAADVDAPLFEPSRIANGTGNAKVRVQLFADSGEGFNEARALSANIVPGQRQAVCFERIEQLRSAPGTRLRIDPADTAAFVEIESIRVVRERDQALIYSAGSAADFRQIEAPNSVAKQEADGSLSLLALDADPQLYLPIIELLNAENYRMEVVLKALPAPSEFVDRYARAIAAHAAELERHKLSLSASAELRSELEYARSRIAAFEAQSASWETAFSELRIALEASQTELGRLSYHREIKDKQVESLELALSERQARLTQLASQFEEDRARHANQHAETERNSAALHRANEEARAQATQLEAQIAAEREQSSYYGRIADEREQQLTAMRGELVALTHNELTARAQTRELQERAEVDSHELLELRQHVEELERFIEEGRLKFSLLWDDLQTAQRRSRELHAQRTEDNEQRRKAEAENAELRSFIDEGRAKFAQLWDDLEQARVASRDSEERLHASTAQVRTLENDRDRLASEADELRRQRAEVHSRLTDAEDRGRVSEQNLQQSRSELAAANAQLSRSHGALDLLRRRADGAKAHLRLQEARAANVSRELAIASAILLSDERQPASLLGALSADLDQIGDARFAWKTARALGLLKSAPPGTPQTPAERRSIETQLRNRLNAIVTALRTAADRPESIAAAIVRLLELRRTATVVRASLHSTRRHAQPSSGEGGVAAGAGLALLEQKRAVAALVDSSWYLARNPDVVALGVDPVEHYLRWGAAEGRDPNPLFATEWYLARNADVAAAGLDPLTHFVQFGAAELRDPHPLFDTSYYVERYADVATARINPLEHYLGWGAAELRDPHPLFDAATYVAQTPEAAGLNPLEHYLAIGFRNNRNPHPLVDLEWYRERCTDVAAAEIDPLQHYIEVGARERRDPSPAFDTQWYLEQLGAEAGEVDNPLIHYLTVGRDRGLQPTRPVDPAPPPPMQPALDKAPAETVFELYQPTWEIPREPELPGEHARPDVQAIAFYLPQFHRSAHNDQWWGEGFTEWTNVRRGLPNFEGHYQPHVPSELGYYDLSDPAALERQARLARAAGIHGFCLYFYWFAGEVLLDFPLRTIVQSGTDFPFCICWANENWTRRWDGREDDILIAQRHSPEDDVAFIDYVEPALTARSYIRVDGKPVLLVYRASLLPDAAATLRRWRERFRVRGHGELHLVMVRSFTETAAPEKYGFDAAVQFPPHFHATPVTQFIPERDEQFSGVIYDYMEVRRKALEEYRAADGRPLYPAVMPSWDNTARRGRNASLWVNSSPEAYYEWLAEVAAIARRRSKPGERFVFVNAWNEWAEGCHLEPDERYGFAWLNATARALHPPEALELECGSADLIDPPQIEAPQVQPLAAEPRVAISVLLFHREDILPVFLEHLLPQIGAFAQQGECSCDLYLSFNYTPTPELRAQVDAAVAQHLSDSTARLHIIENGFNLGFGAGHNAVFARAASDIFIALNSDVEVAEPNWISAFVERFRCTSAAIVGLRQNASVLRSDATGVSLPYRGAAFDFVDASLLAIRSEFAREFDLFSPAFDYFYFEDVDLCLRYRQIGLTIELLDLAVKHERSASARVLPQYTVGGVLNRNRARFFDRWGGYLQTRQLPNRLGLRFSTPDRQLQCASLPAIFGLLTEHPAAVLDVWGVHAQLTSLFDHPRIRLIAWHKHERASDYLRFEEIDGDLSPGEPFVEAVAGTLKTEPDFAAARAHLQSLVANESGDTNALLFVSRINPVFEGAQPSADAICAAADVLRDADFNPALWTEYGSFELAACVTDAVEWSFAGVAPATEILPAITTAEVVVTTAGWVSELAQILDRRLLLWTGAESAARSIWNDGRAAAFADFALDCLGCNDRYGRLDRNTCLRGDIACMRDNLRESFRAALQRFCAGEVLPPPPRSRRSETNPAARSHQLNLTAWPRSSAGSVLVLTPIHPRLPAEMIEQARALAERAIDGLRHCRVVYDDSGEAPLRGVPHVERQAGLAKLRQQMLERHLRDERWVFWVDADITDYPAELIDELIARADGGIAAPLVLMAGDANEPARPDGFGPGRFYDIGGFVEKGHWARFEQPYFNQLGPIYDLESVGSCYLVNADLYRRGARHEQDPASREFLAQSEEWPVDFIQRNQNGRANCYTEHYSVCAFARAAGLPVRAFADLIAWHQRG